MNICKSCGVTVPEEGKEYCPACQTTGKEVSVGLAGSGPTIEKAELKLEDDETQKVGTAKPSDPAAKAGTDKIDAQFEKSAAASGGTKKPETSEEDKLAITYTPLAEQANADFSSGKPGAENRPSALEKNGPKSYLSAEERKALLSELDRPKTGVKEPSAPIKPKLELKRSEVMTVRERPPGPAAGGEPALAEKLPPTAVARGIAYYSGTRIHLVGGAHLAPGEELVFKDRIYVLKEKPAGADGSRWPYIAAVIILFLAAGLLWTLSKPALGGIAGLVLDRRTQSTLPGARVRILEKNQTAVTNEAGFFVISQLPAGSYHLSGEAAGVDGSAAIEVSKGGISPVVLTLEPTPVELLNKAAALNPKPAAQAKVEPPPVSPPAYAALSISVEPQDAEAYFDGQLLGSSGIFNDLPTGRHALVVKREGFQDWQDQVELKTGRTHRVRVALIPKAPPPQAAKKGFEDFMKEGQTSLARADFSRAAASFSEAVKMRSNSAIAHSLLGEAYAGMKDEASARSHYMKAAQFFAEDGSYQNAEELYLKVLESDPNQAQALLALGNVYFAWGNIETARITLQQYDKKFSNSPDGFFSLGKLEYQERRFKEAAKAFEKALANTSQRGLIYGYLTLAYIQNDEKRKAQAAYDNFMKLAKPDELAQLKSHRDWSRVVADLSVQE